MFQNYLFEIFITYNESTGHVGLGPAWVKENSQLKSTDASTNIYRYHTQYRSTKPHLNKHTQYGHIRTPLLQFDHNTQHNTSLWMLCYTDRTYIIIKNH